MLILYPSKLSGTIQLPASKSITHRALICAALADGTSRLSPIVLSQDIQATIDCLQSLGASISVSDEICTVTGLSNPLVHKESTLNCRQSGSTLRFLIPVAALSSQQTTFVGQSSLLMRPMGVYADLFVSQDLLFNQGPNAIKIQGPLQPGLFQIPGDVSSQFISGLLFAAPLMSSQSEIAVLPPYQSKSYVNLSLDMLRRFGISIEMPSDHGYIVSGNQSYTPCDVSIEADYSQLSYFAIYAALKNALSFGNLNPDSGQGDQILLNYLEEAGANLSWNQNELTISPLASKALTIDLADCPDLAPALFVLASFLEGESLFIHTSRLRYKESDRIETMRVELEKFGVDLQILDDSLSITGKNHYDIQEPVEIATHNDHRIAMAMSMFGLINGTTIALDHPEVVTKSYPGFFRDLNQLGARIHEQPNL